MHMGVIVTVSIHICIICLYVYMYVNTCLHVYTCLCGMHAYTLWCVYLGIRGRMGNVVCTVGYSISIHTVIATVCVTSFSNHSQAPFVLDLCMLLMGTHSGSTRAKWLPGVA